MNKINKNIVFTCCLMLSQLVFADDAMIMKADDKMMMAGKPSEVASQKEFIDYSESAWDRASANDGVTVLEFHASWCPTCRSQHKAAEELLGNEKIKSVTFFKVDYDQEVQLKEKLGVTQQSTIIVFKGKKEITRGVGDTDSESILKLITKAL